MLLAGREMSCPAGVFGRDCWGLCPGLSQRQKLQAHMLPWSMAPPTPHPASLRPTRAARAKTAQRENRGCVACLLSASSAQHLVHRSNCGILQHQTYHSGPPQLRFHSYPGTH
jgi:hypothetical protein